MQHNMAPLTIFNSHLGTLFFIPVTSNDASHHASVKTRRYSVIKHRKQKALENNFLQLYTQLHSHSPPPIACRLSSPPPFFRLPIGTQPLYSPPFHAAIISQRQDNTALRKQRELSRGLRCSRREGRKGGGEGVVVGKGKGKGERSSKKDKRQMGEFHYVSPFSDGYRWIVI